MSESAPHERLFCTGEVDFLRSDLHLFSRKRLSVEPLHESQAFCSLFGRVNFNLPVPLQCLRRGGPGRPPVDNAACRDRRGYKTLSQANHVLTPILVHLCSFAVVFSWQTLPKTIRAGFRDSYSTRTSTESSQLASKIPSALLSTAK